MIYIEDNTHAWRLASDGVYHRVEHGGETEVSAQHRLLAKLSGEPAPAAA